jgi:hypothetical protein
MAEKAPPCNFRLRATVETRRWTKMNLAADFHYSSTYSRPLRVLSLWINIVTMLFVQSVLYNLADPDNGRCERQETMSDCLRLKSSLSSSPECVWSNDVIGGSYNQSQPDSVQVLVSEGACSFRPIHHDFDRVLIVAMLSGILSSPFSIFFQSLILFVLSAKTRDLSNPRIRSVSAELNGMKRSRGKKGILASTLQEDFGLLLKKLRLYRNELSSVEREEFECESCFPPPLPLSPFPSLSCR